MADVFISYAHQDEKRAKRVAGLLEKKGLSIWWDRHIPPGKTWDEVIGTALDEAECVVVLWSANSIKSDWVKEEASRGATRGAMVPVIFDHVASPLGFGRIEAAQFSDCEEDNDHPEVQSFLAAVKARVEAGDRREPNDSPQVGVPGVEGAPATPSRLRRWNASIMLGVFLVVALAAGIWWMTAGVIQELSVQIFDVERDKKRSVVASRCFRQEDRDMPLAHLVKNAQQWVVETVTGGQRAGKSQIEVRLSIPANLSTEPIRQDVDPGVSVRTHLYVVQDTGKERVRVDLDQEVITFPEGRLSIEIGAPGYSSVPVTVEQGRAAEKTVILKPVPIKLAVERFSGSDNTIGSLLSDSLARHPVLSLLGPDALETLRAEIDEAGTNTSDPFVQTAIRDSLGVDFIIGGSYNVDREVTLCL